MKKNSSMHKGFTLIELLVVIAIIAILSAAAMVALNSARTKAKAGRVQAEMAQLGAQMELYYNTNNGSYGTAGGAFDSAGCMNTAAGFYTSSLMGSDGAKALIDAIGRDVGATTDATKMHCYSTTNQWAVDVVLPGAGLWCTDSNGVTKPGVLADANSAACL